ncbi:MAG TPA: methyltransferase domain-containing protein [Propionibacteriaceae bacterium]|nr:methyltransferase domain-containing protein [Propionibacteriaceae bacterium]
MSKDLWGRVADTYDADHTLISGADLVRTVQSELATAVQAGHVVELGCGTGLYTRAYAPHCTDVIAVDRSGRMVEFARRSLAGLPNVSVQVGDATATGLPSGSADAVVAVNLLHVVPDAGGVLTEVLRLLRAGGTAVLVDFTTEKLPLGRVLVSVWRYLRRWGPMVSKGRQDFTRSSLEALVQRMGFVSLRSRLLTGRSMNAAMVVGVKPGLQAQATSRDDSTERRQG